MSQRSSFFLLNKKSTQIFLCLLCLIGTFTASAELMVGDVLLSKIQSKYGDEATTRIKQWQTLMQTAKGLPEQQKLKQVNDFFNQHIDFVDDIHLWATRDYWATPVEFLSQGAGDCEDYTIAKYFTLKEVGIPEQKMRLTYVKAVNLNQAHMVLTYFASPKVVPLVLDNLIPNIQLATERKDLLPVYSFNGSGLWLAKIKGRGKRVGASQRLNKWAELKQRMLNESVLK